MSPFSRRFRYPYTACNACGPRISVLEISVLEISAPEISVPEISEPAKTMGIDEPSKRMCVDCKQEFSDPNSRRFQFAHNSCHACGSKTLLKRNDGRVICIDSLTQLDDVDAATSLLQKGELVTFKDSTGCFLACDATNDEAVSALRDALRNAKQSYEKPLALIARDLSIIEQHCLVSEHERQLVQSDETPFVILQRKHEASVTRSISKMVAHNLNTLAFGLPDTALTNLLLKRMNRPIVLTSTTLQSQSTYILSNDSPAIEQIKRAVVRTFQLSNSVQNIKLRFGRKSIRDTCKHVLLTDTRTNQIQQRQQQQQQHAHVVSCMIDNGWDEAAGPVLGVALGGIAPGDDGTQWGGEFLLTDYTGYNRFATFKPVPLFDGEWLERKPWLCTYAHLMAEMGWARYQMDFEELELTAFFESQPLPTLNQILNDRERSPLVSSCTALFDAMIAAIGINRDKIHYSNESSMILESIVDLESLNDETDELAYPFQVPRLGGKGIPYVEPLAMWQAVLGDLLLKTAPGIMSARFHKGLAKTIAHIVKKLCTRDDERWLNTVALSGPIFENKILLAQVYERLSQSGFVVLTHKNTPPGS
jgi:hydrogenase maturation factor HypF (carbamoyltransferase family)